MAAKKTKIVLEQSDNRGMGKTTYTVASLVNRTRPLIGEHLSEDDVKKLSAESENLTVEIKPSKKRR